MITLKIGKIIDGKKRLPISNGVILVDNNKIAAVGEESDIDIPNNSDIIDYSKKTVIPGLIDPHLHLALGPGKGYQEMFQNSDGVQLASGVINAHLTLESGVTTARDCGSRNNVTIDLRNAANQGIISSPRLLVCGRPITTTGGHFHMCNGEADGYEGVRRLTRQLLKDDVDFIKMMTSGGGTKGTNPAFASFTEEEIKAAVEASHRLGKTVTTHCHATMAIENAINAGVDVITHCRFIEPCKGESSQYVFQEDLAKKMVEKRIYADNVMTSTGNPITLERCFNLFENLRKVGVKILPGTDGLHLYGTCKLALVLELMVLAGMTPLEAIQSATKLSAEALGLNHLIGTIEVGKEADLVVLNNDPLNDIRTLRNPFEVIKGGYMVPKTGRKEVKISIAKYNENILSTLKTIGIV